MAEAHRLAALFYTEAGCWEVMLFGSVADHNVRSRDFDIDMAVKGGDFERAQDIAEQSPFPVDLLDYRKVPAHIRAQIDEYPAIRPPPLDR